MAKSRIILNGADVKVALKSASDERLRKLAPKLIVLQLQQVAEAFRRGGQPSKRWPRLWADTFVGEIPSSKKDRLNVLRQRVAKASAELEKAQVAKRKLPTDSSQRSALRRRKATARISKAFNRLQKAEADEEKAFRKAEPAVSYRKGGQPLRDTGQLMGSFFPHSQNVGNGTLTSAIASSAFYAPMHQDGFKTSGPNFIPLTRKALRMHRPGADPRTEGLELGVDYVMAWAGVSVPPRPMIDYTDPVNEAEILEAVKAVFA